MKAAYLNDAVAILKDVKGKSLSMAERKKLSIELAALMLQEAARTMTHEEKKVQEQLARLMKDPLGKPFTTALTDECFRSKSYRKNADKMMDLFQQIGIPNYLSWFQRAEFFFFKSLSPAVAALLIPFVTMTMRKETSKVILPAEPNLLNKHLEERKKEGVRLNLNHLGEAILSEAESSNRIELYLHDLEHPNIDYISVKISTIYSQINLVDFEGSAVKIADRLRELYRAAAASPLVMPDGTKREKFINLDMEEYRDLDLTVEVFKNVLSEEEFTSYSAGIVLQAYLPDSHNIQKNLTEWAKQRVANGGAPIKIRIVKGANLAMEQFEASLRGWPQAPYTSKMEVDANYKRMVLYGCKQENAKAVRLGVASHNLFDLAFAMLARAEQEVERYVGFEMLEGMADHIRRVVQKLSGEMVLYCPVAKKEDFQHAIAYLIRRLDENTGAENFLRHAFGLKPGSDHWDSQTQLFLQSCDEMETTSLLPRRSQNRLVGPNTPDINTPFENEPDTDFALPQNRVWAKELAHGWLNTQIENVPYVINGEARYEPLDGKSYNPSNPTEVLFSYAKAGKKELRDAITCAKNSEEEWSKTSVQHRSSLLARAAQILRERRGELIGAMMKEAGKTIAESDPEVSEAIDFAEYYRRQMIKMSEMKDLEWSAKGTVLVVSPWNFPCSIPAGGIFAALMTGNCVLFKPASDTIFIGWRLINALWDAGIPKNVLQFVPCSGEESGSELITDERLNCVVLTGGTSTALHFYKLRPGLDLAAETGGKNAMIVTAMSDRDLAIKDIIQSAFGHAGQKCSATSLAILEAEVYDDPAFRKTLVDAAASWHVGNPFDLGTKMNPLIHEAKGVLKRALTTLEPGEEWLLEPQQDKDNPNLWTPGIKWKVKPGSFTHMTELFGPVLAVMRADNLNHALELANAVPYGLTSGLQSLDDREHAIWLEKIEAGNLYINRTTTGAIVRRQPFGGTKASNFGGGSKAGGPNYLRELMHVRQKGIPHEKAPVNEWVNHLTLFLGKLDLTAEELGLWTASVASYAYWWQRLQQGRDPTKIVGQDNILEYRPRKKITLRVGANSHPLDVLRVCAAALTCDAGMEISYFPEELKKGLFDWLELIPVLPTIKESTQEFISRVEEKKMDRVRMTEKAPYPIHVAASHLGVHIIDAPVLANGRYELLHFLREVAISIDYHRYGNLGMREGELRKPIL